MKSGLPLLILAFGIFLSVLAKACFYTVSETEQVIITQFGKPVGDAVKDAGLHFKVPFIQKVNRFEKRILEWDGPPVNTPTRDKLYIVVDTFARWRIVDPRKFFENLRDNQTAISRLSDILGSETRNVIAKHDFIETVRTSKDRKVAREGLGSASIADARIGILPPIAKGRTQLENEILAMAAPKIEGLGIELLDVRFKRINYNQSVSATIYQRMISERTQIAERFKSEGAGEAAKILGQRERDLKEIESTAYRRVQEIEGAADAKATDIYARAYNASPDAAAFFEFVKTMETYKKVLTGDTNLILSTDSDLFRYFKSSMPGGNSAANANSQTAAPQAGPLDRLPSLMDIPSPRPALSPPQE